MKGIILAGGSGTRLYPLTQTTLKELLPIYDKPMIYYPLSTLMSFGIRDILIISTPENIPIMEKLFGDGRKFGLNISYTIQHEKKGIAQAFTLGADFIKDEDICLILGDNIFHIGEQINTFKSEVEKNKGKRATIFTYKVSDPERFGVVEFDKDCNVVSIEEKPSKPKSKFASVGLYFYPCDVVEKAKTLSPSARGELEITDLNNLYLKESKISVVPMSKGNAWLDAGTPESLMESSAFVQIFEKRQGSKIACIEEIAYRQGFIDDKKLLSLVEGLKESDYKSYLQKVYNERNEVY